MSTIESIIRARMNDIEKCHNELTEQLYKLTAQSDNIKLELAKLAGSHEELSRVLLEVINSSSPSSSDDLDRSDNSGDR